MEWSTTDTTSRKWIPTGHLTEKYNTQGSTYIWTICWNHLLNSTVDYSACMLSINHPAEFFFPTSHSPFVSLVCLAYSWLEAVFPWYNYVLSTWQLQNKNMTDERSGGQLPVVIVWTNREWWVFLQPALICKGVLIKALWQKEKIKTSARCKANLQSNKHISRVLWITDGF